MFVINVHQAKTQLSPRLLALVEAGEDVAIAWRGGRTRRATRRLQAPKQAAT